MERKKYLVVMAAGHGARMGSALPKQFIELAGRPILQRTIECFVRAVPDIKVVTVLPKEYMQGWKDLCTRNNFYYPQILVEGGITRFHSVRNALKKVPDGAVVAIQDGVRPLLTPELAARMFERMESCRALIPVLPSIDTLKVVENGVIAGTPDRNVFWNAQTPQVFRTGIYRRAHAAALSDGFVGTDDSSLIERLGGRVLVVEGPRDNLKLTVPEDYELLEAAVYKMYGKK